MRKIKKKKEKREKKKKEKFKVNTLFFGANSFENQFFVIFSLKNDCQTISQPFTVNLKLGSFK